MSTALENFVDVGALSDIPREGARRVQAGEHIIAVFRTRDDKVFALADRCPHAGGPLSQGIVHGDCVTCPLHNWVVSLANGTALGADQGEVQRFDVQRIDDRVLLSLLPASTEPVT